MVAHENQASIVGNGVVALPALEEAGATVTAASEDLLTGDASAATPTVALSGSDLTAAAMVEAEAGNSLRIRLKLLDERVVEVEAPPAMSVADFRVKVAHATQVPVYRQRLIYRGEKVRLMCVSL